MTSGIYRIYCKSEDKSYIGKSINIEERWKNHLNGLKKGKHHNKKLQKVFNKYGKDDFEFSILKEVNEENIVVEADSLVIVPKDKIKSTNIEGEI